MNDEKTVQYQCPACGAPLRFSPEHGLLVCDYCDSRFEVDQFRDGVFTGAPAQDGAGAEEAREFDWADYKEGLRVSHASDEEKIYVCPSCGAAVSTPENTSATLCPYCGNDMIIDEQISGGFRPNGIIPFRITREQLPAAMRKFHRGMLLLPRGYFADDKLTDLRGVYVPFWLFGGRLEGSIDFDGTKTRSYSRGDYDYTETSHYTISCTGGVAFSEIPADGSFSMPDSVMDALEPFDTSEAVDFDAGYLSGFYADRFDSDPDENLPRTSGRMNKTAENLFRRGIRGYGGLTVRENRLKLQYPSVRYVLLPVWVAEREYKGETYRYYVNGQTGKVTGKVPVSRIKKALAFFLPFFMTLAGTMWLLLR